MLLLDVFKDSIEFKTSSDLDRPNADGLEFKSLACTNGAAVVGNGQHCRLCVVAESGPLLSLAGRHSTIRGPDADDPLALATSLVDRLFGAGGGGGCRTGALAFSEDALELVVPFALASLTSASDLRMTVRVDCGG